VATLLNETFASGIPGGFATIINDTGTLSVAYNAGDNSVTLTKDAFNALWQIDAVSAQSLLRVKLDIEHVMADGPGTVSGFGIGYKFALQAGYRFSMVSAENGTISRGSGVISSSGVGTSESEGTMVAYSGQGARHLYEFFLVKSSGGIAPLYFVRITRDGTQIYEDVTGYPTAQLAIFGIWIRGTTIKLHSIEVYDDAGGYSPAGLLTASATPASRQIQTAPVNAPNWKAAQQVTALRDTYGGGFGRIIGTVKEKGMPSNLPLARRVRLFHELTGRFLRETWSDATTGNYAFVGIDPTQRYTVVSYDYTGSYRAVIADNLIPETYTP
jgi:hypothetical protein